MDNTTPTLVLEHEGTGSILTGGASDAERAAERPQTVRTYSIKGGAALVWTGRGEGAWTLRAAEVQVYADGRVYVFGVRQTKRGTDYANGYGISTAVDDLPSEIAAAVRALVEALDAPAADADTYRCELCGDDVPALDQPRHADSHEPAGRGGAPALFETLDQAEAEGARRSVERLRELVVESGPDEHRVARGALARDHARTVLDRLDELGAQLAAMTRQRDHALTQVRRVQTDYLVAAEQAERFSRELVEVCGDRDAHAARARSYREQLARVEAAERQLEPPETATVWCENLAHGAAPRNAHHFTPECVHPHYTGSHQPRPADGALQQLADLRRQLDLTPPASAAREA